MKASGKLLEGFDKTLQELEEEYEYFEYRPPAPFAFVWDNFWKIRRTKPFEHPITHTDLYHFQKLSRTELDIWEVDALLRWDQTYYYYFDKFKEQK